MQSSFPPIFIVSTPAPTFIRKYILGFSRAKGIFSRAQLHFGVFLGDSNTFWGFWAMGVIFLRRKNLSCLVYCVFAYLCCCFDISAIFLIEQQICFAYVNHMHILDRGPREMVDK